MNNYFHDTGYCNAEFLEFCHDVSNKFSFYDTTRQDLRQEFSQALNSAFFENTEYHYDAEQFVKQLFPAGYRIYRLMKLTPNAYYNYGKLIHGKYYHVDSHCNSRINIMISPDNPLSRTEFMMNSETNSVIAVPYKRGYHVVFNTQQRHHVSHGDPINARYIFSIEYTFKYHELLKLSLEHYDRLKKIQ